MEAPDNGYKPRKLKTNTENFRLKNEIKLKFYCSVLLVTLQMPNGLMWPMGTILGNTDREHFHYPRKFDFTLLQFRREVVSNDVNIC